jgi:hypothetical protein
LLASEMNATKRPSAEIAESKLALFPSPRGPTFTKIVTGPAAQAVIEPAVNASATAPTSPTLHLVMFGASQPGVSVAAAGL